ncbi:glycosyltransferase [Shewanella sp. Scap07]|uniref:glycosyltransferase n=1 Tax=Shewanella sp. Scap07 TaxID=2589987 RepID=UPI001C4B8C81|nr:glycosyltransferase [Shewanella sp. Scap07]
MKLVSVYIITQNRSSLLKRAIESVFSQDYSALEVIVVDDASTDDTQELVEQLLKNYDFKYLRNEIISGACFSRNKAIQQATGHYITGLDDDDFFCKTRVSDLVAAYRDEYAFVCANVQELMPDGKRIDRSYGFESGEFGLEQMYNYNLAGNQVLTTKTKFEQIGGFDVNMPAFQDYDTWVRLLLHTPKALKIAACNYVLEKGHGGERISSSSSRKLLGFKRFIEKNKNSMSSQQLKSMNIMEHKISGAHFGLRTLLKNVHSKNYKSALNLYIVDNFPIIKNFYDSLKKS